MKIYVIIPVYNAKRFLKKAVDSVLNQGSCVEKIILIDDGSTDGSGTLCDELKSGCSKIDVIHCKENSGVSSARNRGIDYVIKNCRDTKETFLAFLDADDYWNPECRIDIHFIENKDLLVFSTILCDESGRRYTIANQIENRELCLGRANLAWIAHGHFGAVLYSLELVKNYNLRFLEGVSKNEDMIFFREATYAADRAALFSDFLYVYRTNSRSVTHNSRITLENLFELPNAWDRAKQWAKNSGKFESDACFWWEQYCDDVAGQRLLGNVCILLGNGIRSNDICKVLQMSDMKNRIEHMNINRVPMHQIQDLMLYRQGIEELEEHHRKRYWKNRVRSIASKNRFIRSVYSRYKYKLRQIPSNSV